jgi:GTPase SAR1 family protein
LRDLKAHADPDVVVHFAGNKCDKTPAFDLKICEEEAESVGAKFFKTSALSGQGVNELFESLSRQAVTVFDKRDKDQNNTVSLNENESSSSGCC